MLLEIIWGPMYVQDKKTKKWSIRAGIKSEDRVKEYRKRGLSSKKEAKIFWLNYLAENQEATTRSIAEQPIDFPSPIEIKEQIPFEEQLPACTELSVLPSESPSVPTEVIYFNQNKERHIGMTLFELNEKYKLYKLHILNAGSRGFNIAFKAIGAS